ncbi:MAG: HAD family hydrolase [Candidatus Heimdallarchaeota archaeon]|nr:HAD family hydrolase [Candidatus Heimdallarchaeota archaeon]MCK4878328.1 HAD family hydrolase [Candidatus Heimdallarchaeota archaeon]
MKKNSENPLLIIFDFDGVLADSKNAYTTQMQRTLEVFANKEISAEEIRSRIGNTDQRDDFIEFLGTSEPEIIESAIAMYVELTEEYAYMRSLYPEVREVLEKLHKEHFTGIVSRKPQDRMEYWLAHFKITHLFDRPIGTIERTKTPAILKIMNELEMEKNKTIMVGDTEFDIQSAKDAEVSSILALYGASEPEKVLKLNPDYTISHISEILSIVKEFERKP